MSIIIWIILIIAIPLILLAIFRFIFRFDFKNTGRLDNYKKLLELTKPPFYDDVTGVFYKVTTELANCPICGDFAHKVLSWNKKKIGIKCSLHGIMWETTKKQKNSWGLDNE